MLHVIPASPAMDRALDAIQRQFGDGAGVRYLKGAVRAVLAQPDSPAVRARYRGRAWMIVWRIQGWRESAAIVASIFAIEPERPDTALRIAIELIERTYRDERDAFRVASALGRGSRLNLRVLAELRLILRFLRARGMAAEFPRIVEEFAS